MINNCKMCLYNYNILVFIILYMNTSFFNCLNAVLWINLDRSEDRMEYMENLLNPLAVPNIRISAVDGIIHDTKDMIIQNHATEILSSGIKACTLSHLKAMLCAKEKCDDNQYVMICEDDVSFRNVKYFTAKGMTLETIIKMAPEFDVLTLHKTTVNTYPNLYIDWNDELSKGNHIGSAVCYIVSKKGIDKICNKFNYDEQTNKYTIHTNDNIVSDVLLYKGNKAFCYNYNVVTTLDETSTLHSEHLLFHKLSSYVNDMNMIKDLTNNNTEDVNYMHNIHHDIIQYLLEQNKQK